MITPTLLRLLILQALLKGKNNNVNGRVGAINVEQLDELLLSLKTYWEYSNQNSWLQEIKANQSKHLLSSHELAYEL